MCAGRKKGKPEKGQEVSINVRVDLNDIPAFLSSAESGFGI
jgi:hypothetical protein